MTLDSLSKECFEERINDLVRTVTGNSRDGTQFVTFFRNRGYEFASHTKKEKRKQLKSKRKKVIGEGKISRNKSINEL
jgi:hypothetical protein